MFFFPEEKNVCAGDGSRGALAAAPAPCLDVPRIECVPLDVDQRAPLNIGRCNSLQAGARTRLQTRSMTSTTPPDRCTLQSVIFCIKRPRLSVTFRIVYKTWLRISSVCRAVRSATAVPSRLGVIKVKAAATSDHDQMLWNCWVKSSRSSTVTCTS